MLNARSDKNMIRSGRQALHSCHYRTASALAWIAGALILMNAAAAADCAYNLPVWSVQVRGAPLTLEVAETFEARQCGLSGRISLAADHGMLFVFPRSMPVAFWMSETTLRLSIAFLDAHGKIVSIQTMTPVQIDQLYRSPGPVSYAVEVNWDWFVRHGVKVGDIIDLPGSVR